jgi:hypothetical protein
VPSRALIPSVTPSSGALATYWASRWVCFMCGRFHAGDITPPKPTRKCPHCGKEAFLEQSCPGSTRAKLPYTTKASRDDIAANFKPIRGGVQSNGKGYKRKAGERARLYGYHRVLEEGD